MATGEEKTVSFPYLKNYLGFNVDDESMKAVPHAKMELYTHVIAKAAEMGAFLGTLIGLGGSFFAKKPNQRILNGARNGALIGVPLGFMMTYSRMSAVAKKQEDMDMDYQYYDRSYRIRHNALSTNMDRAADVGLLAGAAYAKYKGISMIGGGAVGLGLGSFSGLVLHMVRKSQEEKRNSK